MKKYKKIVLSTAALVLFSACGNDSSSSSGPSISDIKSKDTIVVVQNTKEKDCTYSAIKEETHGSTIGVIEFPYLINKNSLLVKFEETLVDCAKYNRSNDYAQCGLWDAGDGSGKTCVIGLNYER